MRRSIPSRNESAPRPDVDVMPSSIPRLALLAFWSATTLADAARPDGFGNGDLVELERASASMKARLALEGIEL